MNIVLDFIHGENKFQKGTKRVSVAEYYEGHKRYIIVYYFDDSRKDLGTFACCQTPSTCKTEAGAIRCIKKFFKA